MFHAFTPRLRRISINTLAGSLCAQLGHAGGLEGVAVGIDDVDGEGWEVHGRGSVAIGTRRHLTVILQADFRPSVSRA